MPVAVAFDEDKIDAIFSDLDRCHLPGAAVGIAIDTKPVYRKGFGLASLEAPVVLSPATRMHTGSVTKSFTALAYALLCEEGRAGLDDPLGRHLPHVHAAARAVTMRQLMTHTSGLRDVVDLCWTFGGIGRAVSSAELVALYGAVADVNAQPGTAWIYNNGAYALIGAVIERITGQALETVLHDSVFALGMHDTLLRRVDTGFVARAASLHMTGFTKVAIGTASAGDGGVASTVDDLLRWLAHMAAPRIGSPATWAAIRTRPTLANGTATAYGLGLIVDHYRGVETWAHPGGVLGGNAQVIKVPAAGLDVVVLVNRHDVSGIVLANRILDACLPNLDPQPEAATAPPMAGVYRSPTTGRVIQLADLGMVPVGGGVFRHGPIKSYIKQTATLGDGAVLHFNDFGTIDELYPIGPADASHQIAGRYRAETLDAEMTISDGTLTTAGSFGQSVFDLEGLGKGVWRATARGRVPVGGILAFDDTHRGFHFSNGRTRALAFRRAA